MATSETIRNIWDVEDYPSYYKISGVSEITPLDDNPGKATLLLQIIGQAYEGPMEVHSGQPPYAILNVNGNEIQVTPKNTRIQTYQTTIIFETSMIIDLPVSYDKNISISFSGASYSLYFSSFNYVLTFPNLYGDIVIKPYLYRSVLKFNSTAYLGQKLKINVQRLNQSITSTIKLVVPIPGGTNKEYVIQEKGTANKITYVIPYAIANYFPSQKQIEANIHCDDYNGNALSFTWDYPITLLIDQSITGPTISNEIIDINPKTKALTLNDKVLVSSASEMKYTITATPQHGATITSYSIKNNETVLTAATGTFSKPIINEFVIEVCDSRGLRTQKVETVPFINYTTPTITLSNNKPTIDGEYIVEASGLWFNGSFGRVDNTIEVQYSLAERGSTAEKQWKVIPHTTPEAGQFKTNLVVSGLDYRKTYIVQARVVDKLNIVYTQEKVVKSQPVFDWGEDLININVPVYLKEKKVLDLDETTKNITLAGAGSQISIRPKGFNSTIGELVVSDKDITYKGKSLVGGGGGGGTGENGATFTPAVSAGGIISWTNDKGLNNPTPVNIKGAPGTDGVSPQANVKETSEGATITITDKAGTTTAVIKNGRDGYSGVDGKDGFSVVANVKETLTGATITIQDKEGTTTADITNGKDGTNGTNGKDGTNGTNGKDATINGVNTLTVVQGENIILSQQGNKLTIAATGGGGAVESVNNKTGAVVLTAEDVGARPDTWKEIDDTGYGLNTTWSSRYIAEIVPKYVIEDEGPVSVQKTWSSERIKEELTNLIVDNDDIKKLVGMFSGSYQYKCTATPKKGFTLGVRNAVLSGSNLMVSVEVTANGNVFAGYSQPIGKITIKDKGEFQPLVNGSSVFSTIRNGLSLQGSLSKPLFGGGDLVLSLTMDSLQQNNVKNEWFQIIVPVQVKMIDLPIPSVQQ